MTLQTQVQSMSETANRNLVGLVVRWNADDTKIRTLWSEGGGTPANAANPAVDDRPMMYRYQKDHEPLKGVRAVLKQGDAAGFHAEELLIACWQSLLAGVNLVENKVERVDLVLSKTPCAGSSGSSRLIVQGIEVDTRYGMGCAEKLYDFCRARGHIQFRIYYLALAGAHANSYDVRNMGRGSTGDVQRFMTDEEIALDPKRHAVPMRYGAYKNAVGQVDVAQLNLNAADTPRPTEATAAKEWGKNKGRASSELKKAKQAEATSKKSLKDAEIEARSDSLAAAQQGIVRLQSLVNVDIVRWSFATANPDLRGRLARPVL